MDDTLPRWRWYESTSIIVGVLAGVVTGIAVRAAIWTWLTGAMCGEHGCARLPLLATGWAGVALPMLAILAVYAIDHPSRITVWATILCATVMALGVGVFFPFTDSGFPPGTPVSGPLAIGIGGVAALAGVLVTRFTVGFGPDIRLDAPRRLKVFAAAQVALLLLGLAVVSLLPGG